MRLLSVLAFLIVTFPSPTAHAQVTASASARRHLEAGFAVHIRGDLDQAILHYDLALRYDGCYAAAYHLRANARLEKGELTAAIRDYEKAIELFPRNPVAMNNLGLARCAMGDLAGALEDFSRSVHVDPRFAPAYLNRGVVERELGLIEEAMADLNQALRLNPRLAGTRACRRLSSASAARQSVEHLKP
jgi:tetratricopeptide (TPR) repeat protein